MPAYRLGSCAVPDQISPYVEICPPDYDIINEEKDNFCRGNNAL